MTEQRHCGPPPVDPLSDSAWTRVESGLWSRLELIGAPAANPSPVRRWWWVAVPLAAAAATAAIVVIGAIALSRGPSPVASAEPSRVVSGSSSSSVSFGDIHVELEPETALVMTHETGSPTAALERGAAWFTV